MKQSIYMETVSFRIISYGNDTAYAFICKPEQRSVYFQGDDASIFRDELECPVENTASGFEEHLKQLWSEYSDVSGPVE